MKVKFSSFPTFWVKVCPIILMFLTIGLTNIQAQNYKPLDEAMEAVSDALQALSQEKFVKATVTQYGGGGVINTTVPQPSQGNTVQVKVFEVSYFDLFLQEAKIAGDVATAVAKLDGYFASQPPVRATIVAAGKADLMELITY